MLAGLKLIAALLFCLFVLEGAARAAESPRRKREVEAVAAVLVCEAGGERDRRAMQAVLEVVANRARLYKTSRLAVVTSPRQFSCLDGRTVEELVELASTHPRWEAALRLASARRVRHPVAGGALYYHADTVLPAWARGQKPVAWIDHHKFYGKLK